MSRIAIVGSRRRVDRAAIEAAVVVLPSDTVVIVGGSRGPDRWAATAARARGLQVVEHCPDLSGVRCRGEAARRYFARNQALVDDSDRIIAFPAADRSGGTEDTIRRAVAAGKPIQIIV